MKPNPQIEEIIEAARAGDERAWTSLYHHFSTTLHAKALRLTADPVRAADLLQETFVIAFLKLEQLREPGTFGGWLVKIMTHLWYRISRSQHTTTPLERLSAKQQEAIHSSLTRDHHHSDGNELLHSILAGLSTPLRSAVLLRYYTEFNSYTSIATILGIPEGTVRSRLNEAKRKISSGWKDGNPESVIFEKNRTWNRYYDHVLSGLHFHHSHRTEFHKHLHNDALVTLAHRSGGDGINLFAAMVHDDLRSGSYMQPYNVVSSGNLSIVEASHFNSSANPSHCPPRSVMVMSRTSDKISRLLIYPSVEN